ncbi:MAG: DUF971 domain-containing protein [Halieaceae bacterium]|jgi:gamma-butyrobetaine hydroxylase|nr:DUF971 domain-containing protein [Halieaceae bacterium]
MPPLNTTVELVDSRRAIRLIQDQTTVVYHAQWLRDHCQGSCCRNAANGQRLIDVADLAEDVRVAHAIIEKAQLKLQFSDDHESEYPLAWLQSLSNAPESANLRGHRSKTLWDSSLTLLGINYSEYLGNSKLRALRQVRDLGFVVLHDVPCVPGTVLEVINNFGFVRNTNYGELFDVRVEVNPNNLAFSNASIGCHTDNPYRDPVPTIQLLHCLQNSTAGGDSILLDGFQAALLLRQENPSHFECLSQQSVVYRYSNANTDICSRVAMIELDDHSEIVKVRYNNRSIAPLHPQREGLAAFYDAYRHFAKILRREELMVQFKMAPGDLVLFDNTRVMHARSGFDAGGNRHLQGAYADLDGLYSTLAVLEASA